MKTRKKKESKPPAMTPEEFRSILERRGLTQFMAAELLGYSRTMVSYWACGYKPIQNRTALAIRSILTSAR